MGGPPVDHHHPQVGGPPVLDGLRQPPLDVQAVGGQGVHDRGDLALARVAPHPQGVEQPPGRIALHRGGGPDPARAVRLHREHPRGGGAVRELHEHPAHPRPGRQRPDVRPAAHGRRGGAGGRRRGNRHAGRPQPAVGQPLVEQDRQLGRVVHEDRPRLLDAPGELRHGGGEPRVPAAGALDPGRIVHPAQQPVGLRLLTGRVQAHGLARREPGPAPQRVRPGHDPRPGQPGGPQRVLEERDAAARRNADDHGARAGGHSATATYRWTSPSPYSSGVCASSRTTVTPCGTSAARSRSRIGSER